MRQGIRAQPQPVDAVTVLVLIALAAGAGDVITTYQGQAAGFGEATEWLSHLFESHPIGVGLAALYTVRAGLILLGALSTTSRWYVWRVFGFVWLAELAVFGWYVVFHNLWGHWTI